MRTRLGLFVGASLGYYLGAKAGRQRYEQLNRLISKARKSKVYDAAQDRAKAVADVAADRAKDAAGTAKDKVQDKINAHKDAQTDEFSPT